MDGINHEKQDMADALDVCVRNGTPVKQLRWFKTVLDRLLSGGMKEAA